MWVVGFVTLQLIIVTQICYFQVNRPNLGSSLFQPRLAISINYEFDMSIMIQKNLLYASINFKLLACSRIELASTLILYSIISILHWYRRLDPVESRLDVRTVYY